MSFNYIRSGLYFNELEIALMSRPQFHFKLGLKVVQIIPFFFIGLDYLLLVTELLKFTHPLLYKPSREQDQCRIASVEVVV